LTGAENGKKMQGYLHREEGDPPHLIPAIDLAVKA
jgi:hypothetical protein